jgi:hypothetical protein
LFASTSRTRLSGVKRIEQTGQGSRRTSGKPPYYGLSDAFDAASDQLRTNDLTAIAPTVDELLHTHGLTLEKDSTEYRLFSRLVLSGFISVLKVEGERWDGVEETIDFHRDDPTALDGSPATTLNGAARAAPLQTLQEASLTLQW